MKTNRIAVITTFLLAGLTLNLAQGKAATLKVGDLAPKLEVSKWVQGDPVKKFDSDKAYIVEFWATWCGPCRTSIPHLNEIHNKFKDRGLVVVGQDVWETDTSLVEPFVKKMGEQMTYRVALDSGGAQDGWMAQNWMRAAGQNGIPTAFLVDKSGTIAWIGHPMTLKEAVLEQVLDNKYDTKKAAAEYAKKQETEQQMVKLWDDYSQKAKDKEWDAAESALAKIEKALPEEDRDQIGLTRFQMFMAKEDYKNAYQLAGKLSDGHSDNALLQNELAWEIATKEGIKDRNLELAEKIARRADSAANGKNPEILDTVARVLFIKGEKQEAIELQKKAVNLAEGARKKQFQNTLDEYNEGRTPK